MTQATASQVSLQKSRSANHSAKLPGVEIRCPNKTVKTYDGVKKVKNCGALLAVVMDAECGVNLAIKCWRCKGMVRHRID